MPKPVMVLLENNEQRVENTELSATKQVLTDTLTGIEGLQLIGYNKITSATDAVPLHYHRYTQANIRLKE